MDRLEAMAILVEAVDVGSLSAASRKMNVPLPAVSRKTADFAAAAGSMADTRHDRNPAGCYRGGEPAHRFLRTKFANAGDPSVACHGMPPTRGGVTRELF